MMQLVCQKCRKAGFEALRQHGVAGIKPEPNQVRMLGERVHAEFGNDRLRGVRNHIDMLDREISSDGVDGGLEPCANPIAPTLKGATGIHDMKRHCIIRQRIHRARFESGKTLLKRGTRALESIHLRLVTLWILSMSIALALTGSAAGWGAKESSEESKTQPGQGERTHENDINWRASSSLSKSAD